MENYFVLRVSIDELAGSHVSCTLEEQEEQAAMRLARNGSWNDQMEENNHHHLRHHPQAYMYQSEQVMPMHGHRNSSPTNTTLAEQAILHSQLTCSHSMLAEDSILEQPYHPHAQLTPPDRSHPIPEQRTQSLPQLAFVQVPQQHAMQPLVAGQQRLEYQPPSPFQPQTYGLAPQQLQTSPPISSASYLGDPFYAPAMMSYSQASISPTQGSSPPLATSSSAVSSPSPPSSYLQEESRSTLAEESAAPTETHAFKPKCNICFETLEDLKSSNEAVVTTPCGHLFCESCLKGALQTMKKCPLCRRKLGSGKESYHRVFF